MLEMPTSVMPKGVEHDRSLAILKGQPRPVTVQGGAFLGNTTETVLIVGASTRAAAFSALRAGLKPRCLDHFADRDLMAICTVDRVEAQEGVTGLERLALGLPPGSWLYTGPLENHPDRVERISRTHRLHGNAAETLRGTRDPFRLDNLLRRIDEGIYWPSERNLGLLEDRRDLRKSNAANDHQVHVTRGSLFRRCHRSVYESHPNSVSKGGPCIPGAHSQVPLS